MPDLTYYPCADYKPGEDDLQNFDFIRKFQLDVNLDGYPGVKRVRGSNHMQTAYKIYSTADLMMPTMYVIMLSYINLGEAEGDSYPLA